jgi:hypothetical protein
MDRRVTIKWVLAASVTMPLLASCAGTAGGVRSRRPVMQPRGYGADPNLTRVYRPGDVWPLTFTPPQRRTAAALCDVIIPADSISPNASSVGVVDFIDEWVSAPYPYQQEDRPIIIEGLAWMDDEAVRRYTKSFADLDIPQQGAICDDIAHEPQAQPPFAKAAFFFARYRDLTAGGFYSTPVGRKDLQYIGNVALARFEGPSLEVLRKVGLDEAPT